ncbi:MAG: hypothetical protein L0191_20195 [Acidobacteria bacterium]|nr:hypothetical protein [Acidobacteriota bacterium]
MKVIIRFSERQEVRALPILLRHSPGAILPERTYVISAEAAAAVRRAGIAFTELGREEDAPSLEGATAGERV